MKLILWVLVIFLSIGKTMGQQWNQIGNAVNTGFGFSESISLSGDGSRLAVGNTNNAGLVYIYKLIGSTWHLETTIYGRSSGTNFGYSVKLNADGSVLGVGAPDHSNSWPHDSYARVYVRNGTSWTQRGAEIPGGRSFGNSVSLNGIGDVFVVGAPLLYGSFTYGHARISKWNGSAWVLNGSIANSRDNQGASVDLNYAGDIVALGYPQSTGSEDGYVEVYQNNGGTWNQVGTKMTAYNLDHFGQSVSLDSLGTTVAMAGKGAVEVSKWNGTSWSSKGGVTSSVTNYDTQVKLANDGNSIFYITHLRSAKVSEWTGSSWNLKGQLNCTDCLASSMNGSGNMIALADASFGSSSFTQVYGWNQVTTGNLVFNPQNTTIQVTPNPTKNILYIEGNTDLHTLELYNIQGQLIEGQQLNGKMQTNLDLSSLPNGIYLLKIKDIKGKVSQEKIIKK